MGDKERDVARVEAIVYNKNQSRIVCPACNNGRDLTVTEKHVRCKVACACGNVFKVLFVRRIGKRKPLHVKGTLRRGHDAYAVMITDMSLYGFGISCSLGDLNVGQEYELLFSSHNRNVNVTVQVVRVQAGAVGVKCVFVGDHSGARTAIGRIFDKI